MYLPPRCPTPLKAIRGSPECDMGVLLARRRANVISNGALLKAQKTYKSEIAHKTRGRAAMEGKSDVECQLMTTLQPGAKNHRGGVHGYGHNCLTTPMSGLAVAPLSNHGVITLPPGFHLQWPVLPLERSIELRYQRTLDAGHGRAFLKTSTNWTETGPRGAGARSIWE
ncbi:hypothetical protein MIND_01125700 [Mycena indigotica]|uniref:Uncharacterized protein n=1 Tax=Mycena indigotica TaxID=2126181 RepID=A0A8H6S5H9_9AGAR|nr:uncharacterized protein MIND_01125700 [Mycena indigotica]KAF7293480.1 hypothetical protein MIND_01125700 [Mycena indigotica]